MPCQDKLFEGMMHNMHSYLIAGWVQVFLLMATPAAAQKPQQNPAEFALVRTFSLPNLPESNYKSELFRKLEGSVTLPDIVDLNLKFVEEHGRADMLPPQFAPKTSTIILRFADGWLTTNMVRADGQGRFICRFSFKGGEPRPARTDFDKYVDWCHGMLTTSALDPSLVNPP